MASDHEFDLLCEQRVGLGRKWLWPRTDVWAWKHVLENFAPDLPRIISRSGLKNTRVALQAGGCCGMVPWLLSDYFDTVYTFEPDRLNFFCLVNNTQGRNIHCFNAALGQFRTTVDLHRPFSFNLGAHRVLEEKLERGNGTSPLAKGTIPMLSLDSFPLPALDAIFLDVEEHEASILLGATYTLHRFNPGLIVVETKDERIDTFFLDSAYKCLWRTNEQSDWVFLRSR